MTTQKQVKEFAKAHGIRAKWNADYEEWAIRKQSDRAACDYFTTDHDDALAQCEFLAAME